jgi:predicted O-methyltransferase YrrM
LRFGLSTVLGLARRGFFIPYRYAATLPRPGTLPAYAPIERLFAAAEPRFAEVVAWMDKHADALEAIGGAPPEPRWGQDWFPRLDGAAAYVMTREKRPRRIVEIGAGHSTRFFARAVADGGLETDIVTIDPAPRADLSGLPVTFHRGVLQDVGASIFEDLQAGDVVFIDSSHILMPGTDLDFFFGRILPLLPPGVILHVHDIFLPDDYPRAWAWRGYNEQSALPPMLSSGWAPLWSSHYAVTRMADRLAGTVADRLPLPAGAIESSLWLTHEPANDG